MSREGAGDLDVLIIGFAVPEELLAEVCQIDRHMPVQTHKLSWSVIRALERNGCRVDLISSLPISSFPSGRRILVRGRRVRGPGERYWVLLPFANVHVLKHLTRFVACLWHTRLWLRWRRSRGRRVILIYGAHSAHLYAAILARCGESVTMAALLTDPPTESLVGEGTFVRLLRRLDRSLLLRGMSAMNGLVVLTPGLAQLYAPGLPTLVVEGILSSDDESCLREQSSDSATAGGQSRPFTVLYAGGLQRSYGLGLLLDAFRQVEGGSCRLQIFGKGEMESEIQRAAAQDPRIEFGGFLPPSALQSRVREATVLINPRPSREAFTRFSFPSKTLEYLASGRPLVTTRLPGMPSEYFEYVYPIDDETVEGLSRLLRRLRDTSREELNRVGDRARSFVLRHKNEAAQGQKICRFLCELAAANEGRI